MKKIITTLCLWSLCFAPLSVIAAEKVVVIPLNSKSASGNDKEIQYNDGGKIAGASKLFYDKASGFIGMNTSSPAADIEILQSTGTSAGSGGVAYKTSGNSDTWKTLNTGSYFSFALNGTRVAYVSDTGAYVQTSSRKFKNNITEIPTALEKALQLRPVSYSYKHDLNHAEVYGFIAEEVAALFPELVSYDEDGNPGLAYAGFGPIAIRAIQEQQQQIDQLLQENDALKTRLARIEQVLNL